MNEDKTADGSDVVTLKKPEAHLKDSKLLSGKGNVPMARRSISDNRYHSLRGWNTGTRLTRACMRDPSSALMRRSSTWETHHDDRISMAVVTSEMEIKGVWLGRIGCWCDTPNSRVSRNGYHLAASLSSRRHSSQTLRLGRAISERDPSDSVKTLLNL